VGSENSATPPFVVPWDLHASSSSVTRQFSVKEYRFYGFQIAFQIEAAAGDERVAQIHELRNFLGDGSSTLVTRESADSENPVSIPADTDSVQFNEYLKSGEYVVRMRKTGVMVPVHLLVESAGKMHAVVYDQTVQTWSIQSGSKDGFIRRIASIELRPGTYRVVATTTQQTTLPSFARTALRVTYRPDTRPSVPNE
jgi:Domain of unknown function (DUF5625)